MEDARMKFIFSPIIDAVLIIIVILLAYSIVKGG